MADQQKHKQAEEAPSGFSERETAMIAAIVEAMKKPYVDPDITARNERARMRLKQERESAEKNKAAIEDQCSHLREDNTSRIAWIDNYQKSIERWVREGFCQLCQKHYKPGVEGYEAMLKIPVGKAGVIQ